MISLQIFVAIRRQCPEVKKLVFIAKNHKNEKSSHPWDVGLSAIFAWMWATPHPTSHAWGYLYFFTSRPNTQIQGNEKLNMFYT